MDSVEGKLAEVGIEVVRPQEEEADLLLAEPYVAAPSLSGQHEVVSNQYNNPAVLTASSPMDVDLASNDLFSADGVDSENAHLGPAHLDWDETNMSFDQRSLQSGMEINDAAANVPTSVLNRPVHLTREARS